MARDTTRFVGVESERDELEDNSSCRLRAPSSSATMAKKLVHWALETIGSPSLSSLKLPENPADESAAESVEENNSATLQYVNSQLLAHGFTHNKGLSLDGTIKEDAERVLKCLVAMLGQRMVSFVLNDILGAKLRRTSFFRCSFFL